MSEHLEPIYRRYLDALDERRFEDLGEFVHDELVHNGEPMTREQYAAMIAEDVQRIPDLRFDVDLLVVDEGHVACRIRFDCHPRGELFGVAVDGRRVTFAEHVLYRLREGRIEQVWSLVDEAAVRDQIDG